MEIQYLGHSCFRIKGKEVIWLTDPFGNEVGLKMPKVSADIVTISHDHYDHNYIFAVEKTAKREPLIINGPGEYETAGVFVQGISTFHDNKQGAQRGLNTIYVVNLDGFRLVFLGDLGHQLTDEQLEEINGVDILFIPVGGTYTLGPSEAVEVINQIEPKIIIPMHYQLSGSKLKLLPVTEFLNQIGIETKPVAKLVIIKDNLPEERQVVVLEKG